MLMTSSFSNSKLHALRKLAFFLFLIAGALFAVASNAMAQEARPSDKKSDGQFTGIALVTNDPVWYKQFNRPEPPSLAQISHLLPGERGVIATLFSNPTVQNGRVKIECTITAQDADGSSKSFPTGVCYEGPARPPNVLYPSLLDLQFEITENDVYGLAGFDIQMQDAYSDREVLLSVTFMQGRANDQ